MARVGGAMSQALQGPPRTEITLTQQANGRRVGRSMFIGHSVGYLLIFGALIGGLVFAKLIRLVSYDAVFTVTSPATVLHFAYTGLHPYATMALAVLASFVWTDLCVRRRHDRGRSGAGVIIWQMLVLASVAIHTFGNAPDIVGYLDALLVLGGVYLFVVLVLLPGNRGENEYGTAPKPS
jgi:uncharacterized membrane protein YhaH (DUF805 family)